MPLPRRPSITRLLPRAWRSAILATTFTPALAMRSSVSLDRSEVGLLAGVRIVDMPCAMSAFRCLLKQIPSTTKQHSVGPVGKRKIRRRRLVVVPTASALRRTSNLLLGRAGIGRLTLLCGLLRCRGARIRSLLAGTRIGGLGLGCAGICLLGDRRQRRGCKHAADRDDRSKRLERFFEGNHGGVSSLLLNIDVTSQPRRHANQPVRHGTCQGGFDHFVEAG